MRTPEEIKKGLERCKNTALCSVCPGSLHCDIEADALAYIQQLESQVQKWISAEDRLPDDDQDVLICVNGNTVDTGYCTFGHGDCRYWVAYAAVRNNVTHWMPLPELPKEGDEHDEH